MALHILEGKIASPFVQAPKQALIAQDLPICAGRTGIGVCGCCVNCPSPCLHPESSCGGLYCSATPCCTGLQPDLQALLSHEVGKRQNVALSAFD